ncbi:hypothetical protein RJT34_15876 [Clitoria ternatea]|uniref:Uncharacterized protein n=1 Tax=Clitoria ternatea TaxID=43366 RepID=A0AAN9PCE3_CLITE
MVKVVVVVSRKWWHVEEHDGGAVMVISWRRRRGKEEDGDCCGGGRLDMWREDNLRGKLKSHAFLKKLNRAPSGVLESLRPCPKNSGC